MHVSSSQSTFMETLKLLPLLLLLLLAAANARIRHHRWEIAYQLKSPDCFRMLTIAVNGQTPGPTISAKQGDLVVVEVSNALITENTAIHWHGIRQIGTPWSDGTEGVTQCPILPGDTFVYKFVVDKPGTYIYHAHYGMQRSSGLYGFIVVSPPQGVPEPFSYDISKSIILNDWWHKSPQEQAVGLSSLPFLWVGEPQSLLINGRGRFNCSKAGPSDVCNATNADCSSYVLRVKPGQTYRLRIASITSLSALNFEIEGHNMTVVEAGGHYVDPFVVRNLNIYSGETYSVILTADRDPSRNYWIAVNVVSRNPATPAGHAVLNYYPTHPSKLPGNTTVPPAGPLWNDTMYRFNQSLRIRARPGYVHQPPLTSDRLILFLNTQSKIEGRVRWALNGVSFTLPRTPYLIAFKEGRHLDSFSQLPPPETYNYQSYDIHVKAPNPNATYSDAPYRLRFNSTVDIVLQNSNMLDPNKSETHPWHLHGHDFWVLGYGMGKFNPLTDPRHFNLVDPIMMNTVPVHPYGWTAIRFKADNPGVWAFHCHIESHFYLGMGVVFEEGVHRVLPLLKSTKTCG